LVVGARGVAVGCPVAHPATASSSAAPARVHRAPREPRRVIRLDITGMYATAHRTVADRPLDVLRRW
jgi:hypothetical protein